MCSHTVKRMGLKGAREGSLKGEKKSERHQTRDGERMRAVGEGEKKVKEEKCTRYGRETWSHASLR